jgi:hypothetical protein
VRWLIDEMLPPATAVELNALGHDAISVAGSHLVETADAVIYDNAVAQRRTVVTENFADFARIIERRLASDQPCVPVVFVHKKDFTRGGGLAVHLARLLDEWATKNPDPYPGAHWP